MSKMRIGKRFTFEAAHQLPWHDGKCHNLHGHSYVLEVVVEGGVVGDGIDGKGKPDSYSLTGEPIYRPDTGMVADFSLISQIVKPYIEEFLDHKNLNDLMENPTAENILSYLAGDGLLVARLNNVLHAQAHGMFSLYGRVCTLRLWETATSYAELEL